MADGILPKQETGARRFLDDNPEHDGRGVVVAVFDTGVDPGADGLQVTSTGANKIIDIVDCTGDGDVDMSTVRVGCSGCDGHSDDVLCFKSLSDQTLLIPKDWKCSDNKFRVGRKRAYELFPKPLRSRTMSERKNVFEAQNRKTVAQLQREIDQHPSGSDERKELEATLEELNQLAYSDAGPVFDCVVFLHENGKFYAAIDTEGSGDFSNAQLMTNYRDEFQYGTFSSDDLLNYSLNIYDSGEILSIVVDCGSHGTHVASIVAGYFPDDPDACGIAPGAQILACKIGDNRLDSEETTSALIRALEVSRRSGADVLNLSFGEPSTKIDFGRFSNYATEVVNDHGIIFVSSAGNSGPALSTVGAPGGTTTAIIGVGAHVTPSMMSTAYSMHKTQPATNFTWSSRGPALDGSLGVSVCAPGGAIASVPQWTLDHSKLMNGTSMSSPNACGCIALILSGLKQNGIKYTPASVRRALENTAKPIEGVEPFCSGHGLLQVDSAYEQLVKYADAPSELLAFDTVTSRKVGHGVYLRHVEDTSQQITETVMVQPIFPHREKLHEDNSDSCRVLSHSRKIVQPKVPFATSAEVNDARTKFEMTFALKCSQSWVKIPSSIVVASSGRGFEIEVDPRELPVGPHFALIEGYDTSTPDRPAVFTVPITVTKPSFPLSGPETVVLADGITGQGSLQPLNLHRSFIVIPKGATYATLRMTTQHLSSSKPQILALHALQLVNGKAFNSYEFAKYIFMTSYDDTRKSFPVLGGGTLELCMAAYWSNSADINMSATLTFHGLELTENPKLHCDAGSPQVIRVISSLRREEINPSYTVTHIRKFLRPKFSEIKLMGERDMLPLDRQVMKWGDALYKYKCSLPKGDYDIRICIRHSTTKMLTRLKDAVIIVDRKLKDKKISPKIVHSLPACSTDGTKVEKTILRKGSGMALLCIPPLLSEKLPKDATPGNMFVGKLELQKDDLASVTRHVLTMDVPPKKIPLKENSNSEEKSGKNEDAETEKKDDLQKNLSNAVRDAEVGILMGLYKTSKIRTPEMIDLEKSLKSKYPDHLVLLTAIVQAIIAQFEHVKESKSSQIELVKEGICAAEDVLKIIDCDKLAAFYGLRHDASEKVESKMNDKQKSSLIDAYICKASSCLFYLQHCNSEEIPTAAPKDDAQEVPDTKQVESIEASLSDDAPETKELNYSTELQNTMKILDQWTDSMDVSNMKLFLLNVEYAMMQKKFSVVLKLLRKKLSDGAMSKSVFEKRVEIFKQLGWKIWIDHEQERSAKLFPPSLPLLW